MPIPKPREGETQDKFMSRCMGDPTMVKEYDQAQRWQICDSSWKESKREEPGFESEHRRRDLEILESEIELDT